jgi:hypothetical protein
VQRIIILDGTGLGHSLGFTIIRNKDGTIGILVKEENFTVGKIPTRLGIFMIKHLKNGSAVSAVTVLPMMNLKQTHRKVGLIR